MKHRGTISLFWVTACLLAEIGEEKRKRHAANITLRERQELARFMNWTHFGAR
jgi:hypothetical protein